MKRAWISLIALGALLAASASSAQTDTPTATPTSTPTNTPTATPTLIFVNGTGFEDAGAPEITLNGACGITSSGCRTGDKCYRANPTAAVCNAAFTGLAAGQKRVSVWVKGTFAQDAAILSVVSADAAVVLYKDGDGKLAINLGDDEETVGECNVSTEDLEDNHGYRIDLRVVQESAPGADDGVISAQIVDGETQATIDDFGCAGTVGSGTGTQTIRIGSPAAVTHDLTFDDFTVFNGSVSGGDVRWKPIRPSGDSTCGAAILTQSDQQTDRYTAIDEIPHDNEATFLRNKSLSAQNCKFTHPSGSASSPVLSNPVYATRLTSVCKQTQASPQKVVALILGSSTGSDVNLSTSFVSQQRTLAYQPATTDLFTVTGLNSTDIGFSLSGNAEAVEAMCSSLQLNVAFVAGTPTPTNTSTQTLTPTVTLTVTATPADTSTSTVTPTVTPTSVNTSTQTPTVTLTPRSVNTSTVTKTATQTRTPTATGTAASTATQTGTATSTGTPTNTATATPVGHALAMGASATGDYGSFSAFGGQTTVCIDKLSGTISATAICRAVKGVPATDIVKGSAMTDDDCETFRDACEEVFLRVGTCTDCSFNAFGRTTTMGVQWAP